MSRIGIMMSSLSSRAPITGKRVETGTKCPYCKNIFTEADGHYTYRGKDFHRGCRVKYVTVEVLAPYLKAEGLSWDEVRALIANDIVDEQSSD